MAGDPAIDRATNSDIVRSPKRKLPIPIALIALFQFFKAGFLFYLFLPFWHGLSGWIDSGRPPDAPFLQTFLDRPLMIFFPILSIAFLVIGWGLLNLRAWARGFLIGTIICTWVGGRYGSHASLDALFFGDTINLRHLHFETLICLFLLDFFVFGTLVFYPDIAKTFGEKADADIL